MLPATAFCMSYKFYDKFRATYPASRTFYIQPLFAHESRYRPVCIFAALSNHRRRHDELFKKMQMQKESKRGYKRLRRGLRTTCPAMSDEYSVGFSAAQRSRGRTIITLLYHIGLAVHYSATDNRITDSRPLGPCASLPCAAAIFSITRHKERKSIILGKVPSCKPSVSFWPEHFRH